MICSLSPNCYYILKGGSDPQTEVRIHLAHRCTIFLRYQHRNTSMNNKDHLVGQLTGIHPSIHPHEQCNSDKSCNATNKEAMDSKLPKKGQYIYELTATYSKPLFQKIVTLTEKIKLPNVQNCGMLYQRI